MRPHKPVSAACWTCLVLSVLTAAARAQGTPIFTETEKITASDGVTGDQLGYSVSVYGDLLLLGAHRADDSGGVDSGAAYIFRFDGNAWVEEAKLIQPDGTYEGYFGRSVAIHGDIAVVCSDKESDPNNDYGAAYIFRFDGEDWVFEAKCVGDEYASTYFGRSLAAYSDFIVVGDPYENSLNPKVGAGYVYRYNGNNWELEAKLRGDDVTTAQGWGIAADENQIILGSNDTYEHQTSYVFIFRYTGTEWIKDATLGIVDWEDWYGRFVDIIRNLAIVGSADDGSEQYRGIAYIYKGSGEPNYEWTLDDIIEPADVQNGDYFGEAVAIADEHTSLSRQWVTS